MSYVKGYIRYGYHTNGVNWDLETNARPLRQYSMSIDHGIRSTGMNAGNTLVKRQFRGGVRKYNMSFNLDELNTSYWTRWMDVYGYDWFAMRIATDYYETSAGRSDHLSWEVIKMIQNPTIVYNGHNNWTASGVFEQQYGRF